MALDNHLPHDCGCGGINRIRTIHSSLGIEGNTLSEAQITAILEGKWVIAPPRGDQEVKNVLSTIVFTHSKATYAMPPRHPKERITRLENIERAFAGYLSFKQINIQIFCHFSVAF
jgi:hypothetical protein